MPDHADWYKDAVIYELHVRAFRDSNGDGMGDFRGLTSRLDYLADLGVTAVWLLPFYPSPWFDDGYDISDYTSVHEAYGSLRDFKKFLSEAHKRDIKVITELVINHTSDQHPWFERARKAPRESRYRNFYVWSDDPSRYSDARIIFQDYERSNWTWDSEAGQYYWHRFYSNQPDLNFDSPDVRDAVKKILDFWLGMGVDGVRLDAIPYLYEREETNCENLPETHAFLREFRAHLDSKYENRMILAEANQWPEDAVKYFGDGDECHMSFHFPLMPRLFMGVKREDRFPIIDILEQTPSIPENAQWGIFLRNHDELTLEMVTDEERDYMYQVYARDKRQRINLGIRRRLAPLLDNNRRLIELLNVLLFSLPGTPIVYYGDEIGMGDNVYLGDRDGVRTPMQWSPDRNAAFSEANPQQLYLPVIIDPEYHYESVNVETQQQNTSSLLWWMKRLIATRKRYPAFSRGTIEFVPSSNTHVLSFVRRLEDDNGNEQVMLVVVNLSHHVQLADLQLREFSGWTVREVFGQNEFPHIREDDYNVTIGSHDYYWFEVVPSPDHGRVEEVSPITITSTDWKRFSSKLRTTLAEYVLPTWMKHRRWFRSKGRKLRKAAIIDNQALGHSWLLVLRMEYADQDTEYYQIPLTLLTGIEADERVNEIPQSVVTTATVSGENGVIIDGVFDPAFRATLLETIRRKRRLKGTSGTVTGITDTRSRRPTDEELQTSKVLGVEQSNTSIVYNNEHFLKLYRKLEDGVNPDVELIRALASTTASGIVPEYRGHLQYEAGTTQAAAGLLVNQIGNEGDAWEFSLGAVSRYYEQVLGERAEPGKLAPSEGGLLEFRSEKLQEQFVDMVDGFYLEMIRLLGQRTAELHRALAHETGGDAFKPEAFSLHYQRGIYQSARSLLKRVLQQVRRVKKKSSEETEAQLQTILDNESAITDRLSSVRHHKINARKIRIHGDYHLGQVLYTGRDFVIIDMEGEPARPLGERRLKFSPFRDVAGMVRSFHYAAWSGYFALSGLGDQDREILKEWIEPWYRCVAGVFLESYLETIAGAGLIPDEPEDRQILFDLFLLEKAIYELGYEIDNRPDWVSIPLEGISYIVDA
ncbi:MAG: maltose alpha-D-glucosyltransferase [Spirochaetales bacterium]